MPRQDANFSPLPCVYDRYVLWDDFLCCVNDIRALKVIQLKSSHIEETHGNLKRGIRCKELLCIKKTLSS